MQYALLYGAQEENKKLRAENANLGVKLAQLRGIEALLSNRVENGYLQKRQFMFDTYLAPVIWKSAPFHAHRLVVDGGTRQGMRKDDAVIVPEGIVGRVWTTTPFTSEANHARDTI